MINSQQTCLYDTMGEMIHYRDEHLGRLLRSAYADFNRRMLEKMHEAGYEDLTQFQAELLSYIELDGTRIKSLTQKIGVSKQAVGEAILQLAAAGYVKKKTDPADRRVQVLFFSSLGEQFLFDEHRAKAELEQDYIYRIGAQEFELLKKTLQGLRSQN